MILCITHSQDSYNIDKVMSRLRAMGKKVYRLNSDFFSDKIKFSCTIFEDQQEMVFQDDENIIKLSDIEGIWYRKLWGIDIPNELSSYYSNIFLQEYSTMRDLFLEALEKLPCINPFSIDHKVSSNKYEQLQVANSVGIKIPQSIFTNNFTEVESFFYKECGKNMIVKLHGVLQRSMAGDVPFFPTTLIQEKDLGDLSKSLLYCPMIFQQHIEKKYELRIIYVEGIFFAAKIDARNSEKGKIDWRIAQESSINWEPYTLPEFLSAKLTKLMQKMKLHFGAIDVIKNTKGEYVFLEVNPQGEWGMLQMNLGYPIGETIAEKLVEMIKKNNIKKSQSFI